MRYAKDPVAEEFTVEIFEDLHFVLDRYIVELAVERGSAASEADILHSWESEHREKIEAKRNEAQANFGALLPLAFIASNVKFEYLVSNKHAEFRMGAVPEDVVEIMQEFLEIVAYREELES